MFVSSEAGPVDEPELSVLNSVCIGASLYDEDGVKDAENVTVTVNFKLLLSRDDYNASGENCYL